MQPKMEKGEAIFLPTALAELFRSNTEDKEFNGF